MSIFIHQARILLRWCNQRCPRTSHHFKLKVTSWPFYCPPLVIWEEYIYYVVYIVNLTGNIGIHRSQVGGILKKSTRASCWANFQTCQRNSRSKTLTLCGCVMNLNIFPWNVCSWKTQQRGWTTDWRNSWWTLTVVFKSTINLNPIMPLTLFLF